MINAVKENLSQRFLWLAVRANRPGLEHLALSLERNSLRRLVSHNRFANKAPPTLYVTPFPSMQALGDGGPAEDLQVWPEIQKALSLPIKAPSY